MLKILLPVKDIQEDFYCLYSIMNYCPKDHKVILYSNGSNEETLRIIRDFSDKNPEYFKNHVDLHIDGSLSSLFQVRNRLIDIALIQSEKEDDIAWVDSDDTILPEYLYFYKRYKRESQRGKIYVGDFCVLEKGNIINVQITEQLIEDFNFGPWCWLANSEILSVKFPDLDDSYLDDIIYHQTLKDRGYSFEVFGSFGIPIYRHNRTSGSWSNSGQGFNNKREKALQYIRS